MKNLKFKRTLGLFIWMFIILFFFNTTFTWINYYQFKTNSEQHQLEQSTLIADDLKNRYESLSTFLNGINPYISDTVEKSLYSIEEEINNNGRKIDNSILESLRQEYSLTNIYVLDEHGIVTYATDAKEVGKYSREFYSNEDRKRWESEFKKIIKTQDVYIEDKFYRSEIHPYRYHKWGYKGIGYIEGLGYVVLEVGLQVIDIKDKTITPLVDQVIDLDTISKNVISLDLVNLPPNQLTSNKFKESQIIDENGIITTKLNMKGIDGSDMQAIIKTKFSSTNDDVKDAFKNALIWTIFYAIFSSLMCLLLYYRFSIPVQYVDEDVINKRIQELDEL